MWAIFSWLPLLLIGLHILIRTQVAYPWLNGLRQQSHPLPPYLMPCWTITWQDKVSEYVDNKWVVYILQVRLKLRSCLEGLKLFRLLNPHSFNLIVWKVDKFDLFCRLTWHYNTSQDDYCGMIWWQKHKPQVHTEQAVELHTDGNVSSRYVVTNRSRQLDIGCIKTTFIARIRVVSFLILRKSSIRFLYRVQFKRGNTQS